jgi:tRNA/rRNA methyltransferase
MNENPLDSIRIVLVEPAGALNVGSIARVMKNMGLQHLILVNPQCDRTSDDARKMAVHARDLLDAAQIVPTLPDAIAGCQRVIATSGRDRTLPTDLEPPRTALPWLFGVPSALIFGREDRGLNNQELNYAQRFVRIPSNPEYPSLNLAQSVAICAYELAQCAIASEPQLHVTSPSAPVEVLEQYYKHLETLLLKIGYLYPHTTLSRMEKFRRLYNRAELSSTEVSMLQGILSQVEWALSQVNVPEDPPRSDS